MKILDCTLRDGGYYTDWDFSKTLVDQYLTSFNELPVDYLEVGYRSPALSAYSGQYYYLPKHVLTDIAERSNKQLAILLNEKDIDPASAETLLGPCKEVISMVRLAVDPERFDKALKLGKEVKNLGFELCFNVMYLSRWEEFDGLIDKFAELDGIADYIYMVDSYGGIEPEQLEKIIADIRQVTSTKLGFHGHNNLEMALINTLTAIKCGVDIVDATVTGMGRGAGNLKTELLLTYLNKQEKLQVDFNALSAVVSEFETLNKSHGWGTNLPYMVSGANSLPQKEVMEWTTKRFYSINSITRALENKKEKRADNEQFKSFNPTQGIKEAVIIGGGASVSVHREAILKYCDRLTDGCIIHASSKNARPFLHYDMPQYFCLVGNEGHRMEKLYEVELERFKGECILPPFPREMGTYVPPQLKKQSFELEGITFTDLVKDSHTVLALQVAIEAGVERIALVGYDGYGATNITGLERSLELENERLFADFKEATAISMVSLLPSFYQTPSIDSVYASI